MDEENKTHALEIEININGLGELKFKMTKLTESQKMLFLAAIHRLEEDVKKMIKQKKES